MPAPLEITFACPQSGCGEPVDGPLRADTAEMACDACGRSTPLHDAASFVESAPLRPCPVCGGDDFYVQRDFNRKLGLSIVAVGCVLGPFTSWISVVVAVVVDAVLYLVVPSVAVCYACNAQYRGFLKEQKPEAFEIAIHDAYKFAKRHPPRRDIAVAGPLQTRLRFEGKVE